MKRFKGFLFGIICFGVILCGLCFAGCGNNYDKVQISLEQNEVNFKIGYESGNQTEAQVSATVSGTKKDSSKNLEFISSNSEVVRVDNVETSGEKTTAKLVAVGGGNAVVYVRSEGNVTRQISVNVKQEASGVGVDANYFPVLIKNAQGGFTFNLNKIVYFPASSNEKDVKIELWDSTSLYTPVVADAKVISQDVIDGLSENASYYFKITKSTNQVVAIKNVDVRKALDEEKIELSGVSSGKINLSTSDLGIDGLRPSSVRVFISYDGDETLTDFDTKISVLSAGSFTVTDVKQTGDGRKYFDVNAMQKGSGNITFSIFYDGLESTKITKVIDVDVALYSSEVETVLNGGIVDGNEISLYSDKNNQITFSASPAGTGAEAFLRLKIDNNSFMNFVKDSGTTSSISGVNFTQSAGYFISDEFESGKTFNFILTSNTSVADVEHLIVFISKATGLFEEKEVGTKEIEAHNLIAIDNVTATYNGQPVSEVEGENTNIEITPSLDGNNNVSFGDIYLDIEISPVNADVSSLQFSCTGATASFDLETKKLIITPSGIGQVSISVTANYFAGKTFFINFYTVASSVSANMENAQTSGNAVIDSNVIYLTKSNNDVVSIPVSFDVFGAESCTEIESFTGGEGFLFELVDGALILTSSDLATSSGQIVLTFANKFDSTQKCQLSLNVETYSRVGSETVKFFDGNNNVVSQISLDSLLSVGIYGDIEKTFYLGVDDGHSTFNFEIVGGQKDGRQITTDYGTLTIDELNPRKATFKADQWTENGKNVAYLELIGTVKQFENSYSVRVLIEITKRAQATNVNFTNVDSSLYVNLVGQFDFNLETLISPTNAYSKNVVFVVTDNQGKVLGTTLNGEIDISSLILTEQGRLIVLSGQGYRIFAVAKSSIKNEIIIGETIDTSELIFDVVNLVVSDGSEDHPFLILTFNDLISADFSSEGKYYKLTADIDCGNIEVSLGHMSANLDGNGHKIYNFAILSQSALFDSITGSVLNLTISNVYVLDYGVAGYSKAVLAGQIDGVIDNITIHDIIIGDNVVSEISIIAVEANLKADANIMVFSVTEPAGVIIFGAFKKVTSDEPITLTGVYLGNKAVIGELGESVTNNIVSIGEFEHIEVSITKTSEVKHETARKDDGTAVSKLVYYVDLNESFTIANLFNVTSIGYPSFNYNLPYILTFTDGILSYDSISESYTIKKFGECTFTATSEIDSSVSSNITICFLPKNVEFDLKSNIKFRYGESFQVNNSINNGTYSGILNYYVLVTTTGVVAYDQATNSLYFETSTSNGSYIRDVYVRFNDESKLKIATLRSAVFIDKSANAISGSVSKSQISPNDTAELTVIVNSLTSGEKLIGLDGQNGVKFKLITQTNSGEGEIIFKYLVYVDNENVNYNVNNFTIYPDTNSQETFSFTVEVVRANVNDVAINHFTKPDLEVEQNDNILSNQLIDNTNINVNETSTFAFYISPEIVDVRNVRITSDSLGLNAISISGEKVGYTAISGGISFNEPNPFVNGFVYVNGQLGNVALNTQIWVKIEVDYIGLNGQLQTFEKTVYLTTQKRATLEIIAPDKVASLCDFDVYFTLNGNILNGKDFKQALDSLNLGSNFIISEIFADEGRVVLQSKAVAVSGNKSKITTAFEEKVAGVLKKYNAEAEIEVFDVLITGVDFVSGYGSENETVITDILTVTAFNPFTLGFRFRGEWDESFNSTMLSFENYLNSFTNAKINDVSTFFKGPNGESVRKDEIFDHFKVLGTEEVEVGSDKVNLIKMLPLGETSSTGINFSLNYGYKSGRLFVKVNNLNKNINKVTVTAVLPTNTLSSVLSVAIDANSSLDCPLPISTVDELLQYNTEGANLILINDITLSNWTPIEAKFESLDGNGYSFILNQDSFYDYLSTRTDGSFDIGIFSVLPENSIIKNLNVKVSAQNYVTPSLEIASAINVRFSFVAENENAIIINYGTLVAQNNGFITNCHLLYSNEPQTDSTSTRDDIMFFADINRNGFRKSISGSIGGLVAVNRGTITHSSSVVDLLVGQPSQNTKGDFNVGGFVAYNNGVISSSYLSKASVRSNCENDPLNGSTEVGTNSLVAGFVAFNSLGANINSCYVFGGYQNISSSLPLEQQIRSNYKKITSTTHGSAFTMINRGKILNSYANIDVSLTSNTASGFIYLNDGGTVQACYSASKFAEGTQTGSHPFISELSGNSVVSNCYALKYGSVSDPSSVVLLSPEQFTKEASFVGFGFPSSYNENDADWSFEKEDGGLQKVPKIVSTQAVTSSRRTLVGAVDSNGNFVDPSEIRSKVIQYHYYEFEVGDGFYDYGTKNNPILITNITQFKTLLINGAVTYGKYGNDYYYRLLSDIDFSNELTAPKTTTSTFYGFLEGNGMSINNLRINVGEGSSIGEDINEALGLFGKIDGTAGLLVPRMSTGTNSGAGVRNLTVNINELFANTYVYVGGLAGVVNNAYIYNIDVNFTKSQTVSAYGRNIIGGVIGLAVGASDIYNLTSNVSVFSTYVGSSSRWSEASNTSGLDNSLRILSMKSETYATKQGTGFLKDSYEKDAKTSYAGAIIGVLDVFSGSEKVVAETLIYRPQYDGQLQKGARVGGVVGHIGEYSFLRDAKIDLSLANEISIIGSDVAGGIAGENYGKIENSQIEGYRQIEKNNGTIYASISTMFDKSTCTVLGGVVGININGVISGCTNFTLEEFEKFSDLSNSKLQISTKTATYFGGVAGISIDRGTATISNSYNLVDLINNANNVCIGGVVGYLGNGTGRASEVSNCFNIGGIKATSESRTNIGGLVGKSTNKINIETCFSVGEISSNCNSVLIGGLVGNGGDVTITDSFTSSLLNNNNFSLTSNKAGLVGGSEVGNSKLTINNSYVIARSDVTSNLNLIYGSGINLSDDSSGVYTVLPYLQTGINAQDAENKTFVELNRILLVNSSNNSWNVEGGWAPINNLDDVDLFKKIISNSKSPFVYGDYEEVTSSTGSFVGTTNYVLNRNLELNSAINASGWSGTLIGNGFTITIKNGNSLFNNLKAGTIFNVNINLDGSTSFVKTEDFGALTKTLTGATVNVFDVNIIGGTIFANKTGISVGAFVGKAENSTINFTGCINNVNVESNVSNENVKLGGFVGESTSSSLLTFTSCLNAGRIGSENQSTTTGGFIGSGSGEFDQCISAGDLFGTAVYAFVGDGSAIVSNSIASVANGVLLASETDITNKNIETSFNLNDSMVITLFNSQGGKQEQSSWSAIKTMTKNNSKWSLNNNISFVLFGSLDILQTKIEQTNSPLKLDPINISTASELLEISGNGIYGLTNDITLTSSIPNSFSGSLIGNGYEITLSGTTNVFADGMLGSAIISDVVINGGNLANSISSSASYLNLVNVEIKKVNTAIINSISASNCDVLVDGCIVNKTTSFGSGTNYSNYFTTFNGKSLVVENYSGYGSSYKMDYAFYNATKLISVSFSSDVTSIGSYAFRNCTSLTEITIPENVTSIGSYAFYGCSNLIIINFDAKNANDLTSTSYVFSDAGSTGEGITVTFGDEVEKIPAYLFYTSTSTTSPNIKKVIIGENVKSLGNYAFRNCSALTEITIPEKVNSIGSYAFYNCSNLTTVIIDSSTVASELTALNKEGYLINYAKTVFVRADITAIGSRLANTTYYTKSVTTQAINGVEYYKYTKK